MTPKEFLQEIYQINEEEQSPFFMEIIKLKLMKHYKNKYMAIMEGTTVFEQAVLVLKENDVKTEEDVVQCLNRNQTLNVVQAFKDHIEKSISKLLEEVIDDTKLSLTQVAVVFIQFTLLNQQENSSPLMYAVKRGIGAAYCEALNIPSIVDELQTDDALLVKATEEALTYTAKSNSDSELSALQLIAKLLSK